MIRFWHCKKIPLMTFLELRAKFFGYQKLHLPRKGAASIMVKFGFSEKATKFEKNLCHTFDKSVLFCARNRVTCQKVKEDFSKHKMWSRPWFINNVLMNYQTKDFYFINFHYTQLLFSFCYSQNHTWLWWINF